MKHDNLFPKALLVICAAAAVFCVAAQELPPGVPRVVDTNGNTIHINSSFTTEAFQKEALESVIREANQVAEELRLPEKLPITQADLRESFISPFGYSYTRKRAGNITTSNYLYGVERDYKFSELVIANYDQVCISYRENCLLPTNQMDPSNAFQLATQWLAAVSIDVKGLNRDCLVKVEISHFWNATKPGAELTKPNFVPIYDVSWLSPENQAEHHGDMAFVELFSPTKTILQLVVQDPKYILRKPLAFTNLPSLFPGKAPIVTNYPVRTIASPPPISN